MTQILTPLGFKWFLTLVTGIVAAVWFVWDGIKIARLTPDTPSVGDKRFGYMIGMAIGAIGVIGCLRFWNVV